MAPTEKTDLDQSGVSSKRVLFVRKHLEEKKMQNRFEKARRSGIRAASEIHTPFTSIKSSIPLDFKIMIENNPELASRF